MGDRRLRVGIDVSSAVDARPTGVARYIHFLVDHLDRLEEAPELTLLCRPSRYRRGDPSALFGRHRVRRARFGVSGVDVLHSPDVRLPMRLRVPAVVTVHDLSAFERDDHATARFLRRKRAAVTRAVGRAEVVVTHSEAVRGALLHRFGLPAERVAVVPLASGLPPRVAEEPTTDPAPEVRRLLVVGGPSVRKGEARLGPFLEFAARELDWQPEVDWVGSGSLRDHDRLIASLSPGLRERIRFHGHVDDSRLDHLYRESDGFLQLSDTEGFAMPLLEAAERDCPILSIDAPVLRETIGAGALFFTDDFCASRAALASFCDPAVRRVQREVARRQSEAFNWSRTAVSTLRIYRRCSARD